jgi:hypothetical protein
MLSSAIPRPVKHPCHHPALIEMAVRVKEIHGVLLLINRQRFLPVSFAKDLL